MATNRAQQNEYGTARHLGGRARPAPGRAARRLLPWSVAFLAVSLVAACGSGSAPGEENDSENQAGTTEQETSTTAPVQGSDDLEALVQAAQEEGTLLLNTLVGDAFVDLANTFGDKYGIEVEVTQGRVSDMSTQVLSERSAGNYTVDAWYQTWSVMHSQLMPAGALDPVAPELILDEVVDESNWKGGSIRYMDEEQQYLPAIGRLPGLIYTVNTDNVPEEDRPTSLQELVDFDGEIATALPGQSGDEVHLWLMDNGREDLLIELAEKRPTQIADLNQAFLDLARGTYDLLIGGTEPRLAPVMEEGLPVEPVSFLPDEEEMAGLETFNAVTPALASDAPHPNAARLFVNWIMSQEGATLASQAGSTESARVDVPTDHLLPHHIVDPDAEQEGRYQQQDLEMVLRQDEQRERLAEIFNY